MFLFDQIIQQQWGNICTSKISFVFHLSLKKRHTSHIHFMLNSPIWRIPNSLCTVGDDRHWNLAVPDFWIPVILDGFLLTFSKHLNFLCCLHCRQESIYYMYLHNFKLKSSKTEGDTSLQWPWCKMGSISEGTLALEISVNCNPYIFLTGLIWEGLHFHLTLRVVKLTRQHQ